VDYKEVVNLIARENVPDTIKKSIGEYIEEFAIDFYKVRGEL